ncbi:MAG: two-component system, NtrC family, response regulator AtoC [Thermoanaerobaculia bacterium]|nr:two-component system, NtrC family, response regulator AtoC [Thermoanaerobaculia bacterium]
MMNSADAASGPLEVWWESVSPAAIGSETLLLELQRAGISLHPARPETRGPGLVLFTACTKELLATLHQRSRGGTERVIAVALEPASLARGEGWELLQAGAADVFPLDGAAATASAIAARFRRWGAVDALLEAPVVTRNLVGENPRWRAFLRRVVEIARFSASPVLVRGESGTGKELVARLIHVLDPRADKRELVILDCSTVVPELSGSEFFGHERGAYTGASAARDGAFALADGGTLFLDEVGELPLRLQAELLRVVQEGTYKRVGGNTWQRTRFRLVCATHRDLEQEMMAGRFRGDFYYRLAAWSCTLPPLHERRDDIPGLARHFLQLHFKDDAPAITEAVLDLLMSRGYAGNVRDLRHLIDRIAYRHAGNGPITLGDVPEEERPATNTPPAPWAAGDLFEQAAQMALLCGMGMKDIGAAVADASVRLALDLEKGNVGRAAERLGITDRALQKRRAIWRSRDT